jgi:hypothetical protein
LYRTSSSFYCEDLKTGEITPLVSRISLTMRDIFSRDGSNAGIPLKEESNDDIDL